MEKETGRALLIVSIENPNRLNAAVTEDYFLVDIHDYHKAVEALTKYEESTEVEDIVDNTSGAISILKRADIDFERIIEGRRFFFNNEIIPDEDGCNN